MILVTGGAYQGKLEYAMDLWSTSKQRIAEGATCEITELFYATMIHDFQLCIKRLLEGGKKPEAICHLMDQMLEVNKDIVIITNELGCGVVPMEAFDRMYRELVGRICCKLAKEANQVHRVTCGLGMVIRHD